jgi:peptidoglycan/LPS O-acetylase OafA/YrhL
VRRAALALAAAAAAVAGAGLARELGGHGAGALRPACAVLAAIGGGACLAAARRADRAQARLLTALAATLAVCALVLLA